MLHESRSSLPNILASLFSNQLIHLHLLLPRRLSVDTTEPRLISWREQLANATQL
jgi:hypothetical protein